MLNAFMNMSKLIPLLCINYNELKNKLKTNLQTISQYTIPMLITS